MMMNIELHLMDLVAWLDIGSGSEIVNSQDKLINEKLSHSKLATCCHSVGDAECTDWTSAGR